MFQVKHPNKVLPPVLGASMHALACILSYDGLTGIPLESVEMLTSMVNATEISNFVPGRSVGTHKTVSWFLRSLSSYTDFTVPEVNGTLLNDPLSQNFLPLPDSRTANPSGPLSPNFRASPNSVYARSALQPHRKQKQPPHPHREQKQPPQAVKPSQHQNATQQKQPPQPVKPSHDQNATHQQQQQQHAQERTPRKQRKSHKKKPPSGDLSLNGYGLSMYGPYGPRGVSLKRPRSNGVG